MIRFRRMSTGIFPLRCDPIYATMERLTASMFEQTSRRTKQIKGHGRKRRLGCASQARTVDEIKSLPVEKRPAVFSVNFVRACDRYACKRIPPTEPSRFPATVRGSVPRNVVPPLFRSTLQTRDTFGKFSSTLFTADLLERRITSESTREYKRFRNVRHIRIYSSLDAPTDFDCSS